MDVAEVEFLAEEVEIEIIPKFNDPRVYHLICGDFGPLRAGIPCSVPIWFAVDLKKRQRCSIVVPDWLNVTTLELLIQEEWRNAHFTRMPSDHYMGIAHLLFSNAVDDIPDAERVRSLIVELWCARIAKARTSAITFISKDSGRHAAIDHMNQMEICTIRPVLNDALDTVASLSAPLDPSSYLNMSSFIPQSESQSQPSTSHSES